MKKLFKLENFIFLIVFLLPVYLVRFSVFGVPINVLETLILVAFLVWIFKIYKSQIELPQALNKKYVFLISLIFVGLIGSLLANKNYLVGLGIVKGWFAFPLILGIISASAVKEDKKNNLFLAYFLSCAAVSIIALGYLFLGKMTYDGRLQAFFNSPNYLAMYLSPGIVVGAVLVGQMQNAKIKMQNDNAKFKIIILIFYLTMLGVLYLTYSYAAWISLVLALGITFLLNNKFSKKIFIVALLALLVLIFVLKDTAKFNDLVSFNERSSLASRVMIWKSAGKMVENNWLWGIGPGNFQNTYLEYQKYYPPYLEWAVPHPHSLYLAFWLYCGIIGFVGFLSLMFLWIKKALGEIKKGNELAIVGLAIVAYILIHGFFDTTYFKNDLASLFWVVFLSI